MRAILRGTRRLKGSRGGPQHRRLTGVSTLGGLLSRRPNLNTRGLTREREYGGTGCRVEETIDRWGVRRLRKVIGRDDGAVVHMPRNKGDAGRRHVVHDWTRVEHGHWGLQVYWPTCRKLVRHAEVIDGNTWRQGRWVCIRRPKGGRPLRLRCE